jgi:hypothetical protein
MSKQILKISESLPEGNLRKGFIPLDITSARIVATNDVGVVGATDGGTVAKDSDPILERVNGATDKMLRLSWASASTIEVMLPTVAYPPDLDDTADVTVKIQAVMKAASVNTPVIAVGAFNGIGDTNFGGNTAALSTSLQTLSVTLTAANVDAYPKMLALTLTPGAHATASNDVYVYGAWIEYTRKA